MDAPISTPNDRFRSLLEVSRKMGSTMDFEVLLREILVSSQDVMCAEAGSIFLPDPESGELIIHSASGDKAPLLNATRIPKGAGIAGSVFLEGKIVNIKDTANDPRHYRKVDEKTGFITRAMITAPLLSGGRCLGVVQVLNPKVNDFFDEADEEIFEGFASLIATTLVRLEAQKRMVSDEKQKQELSLASEIQQSFLPPAVQELDTCKVLAAYFPAKAIGGDFYFVHRVKSGNILVGLGDMTGKGIPAALSMARATADIKAHATNLDQDLGAWVSELNTTLCEELHQGRFIGITFLMADPHRNKLQICNAGQYAPLFSSGAGWSVANCAPQLPVGIMPEFQYQHVEVDLQPGQIWVLYSDGITEARNGSGEEYSDEQFISNLPEAKTSSEVLKVSIEKWENFMGKAEQHDDSTLMIMDWRGLAPAPHLDLKCCTSTLCQGRDYIENWAKHSGFDDITVGQIVLAVDEAATNVYRHAYGEKAGPIRYEVSKDQTHLQICIIDQGKPAEVEKIKGRELDDLRPGGLGTILLQQVFETVQYAPQDVGTILTLKKALPGSP